jgi:hypothetical protein
MHRGEEIITVHLPRWAWDGIVEGIESWTGRKAGDIQILDVAEVEGIEEE